MKVSIKIQMYYSIYVFSNLFDYKYGKLIVIGNVISDIYMVKYKKYKLQTNSLNQLQDLT